MKALENRGLSEVWKEGCQAPLHPPQTLRKKGWQCGAVNEVPHPSRRWQVRRQNPPLTILSITRTPPNTRRSPNDGLALVRPRKRWTSVEPVSGQHLLLGHFTCNGTKTKFSLIIGFIWHKSASHFILKMKFIKWIFYCHFLLWIY